MKKNCPQCGDALVDQYKCECGWISKNYQAATTKQCFHCHKDIDGYYRVFHGELGMRYKCADCLLYADLDWRDKLIAEWLELHPDFKFKPQNAQDQEDLQEMSMAYIRKITKGGSTARLPYDKTQRLSDQVPPIRFDDLEDKEWAR